MELALSVEGVDALLDKIKKIQTAIIESCRVSAKESAPIVVAGAQKILLERLYIPNGGRYRDTPITEELLNGFLITELEDYGKGLLTQEVFAVNSIDKNLATWFEFGTNEHWIEPVNAEALAWIDAISGDRHTDPDGHDISGVEALHFLRDGFANNRQKIINIFRKNCSNFIREAI